jgi:hypothetical protein
LGTSVVDRDAVELIAAWIESLEPAYPAPAQPAPVVDAPAEKPPEKPAEQTASGDAAAVPK